ncbi:Sister chromatid cohesion protein [Mycena venus]|uniref:Sister chromatid cohesion protein n=1 Tax=Mycena venus TaxID=2733690 RepID=A0A8H6Z6M8_9AGAR|nr:Sister chromatid cohesion protein [Mycena venus]
MAQLWDGILKIIPNPPFTRKVISSMLSQINATEWKRDPDELKSAKILLDEFSHPEPDPTTGKTPLYSIESIPLLEEPGFNAIAFCLPKILREVGGRVREISLDSAWDTNGSCYEVFALLGEVYGSGMPLGYLLIQSSSNAAAGGKERFIRQLLAHFRAVWKIKAIITLSDKEWSEINAFLAEYPEAKHQLCFWHALRALKKRLSILRRMPAHYDVALAHSEFTWIDKKFIPIAQCQDLQMNTWVAPNAIPQVIVRFQGVPMSSAPKPISTTPSLTLRLNGVVRAIVPRLKPSVEQPVVDADNEGEEGDLMDDVENFLDKDNDEDEEDGPDWMFEDGEKHCIPRGCRHRVCLQG